MELPNTKDAQLLLKSNKNTIQIKCSYSIESWLFFSKKSDDDKK